MNTDKAPGPRQSWILRVFGKLGRLLSIGGGALGWKRFFNSDSTSALQIEAPNLPPGAELHAKGHWLFNVFRLVATLVAAGGGALAWKQCFRPPPPEQQQEEGDPRVSKLLDGMLQEYEDRAKEKELEQNIREPDETHEH